jgi:CheY-like chemotaxis protein
VDVLKFIRSQPRLAELPVVVLTNEYLNELGTQAAALGVERALLKARCTPSTLMATIDEIMVEKQAAGNRPQPGEVPASAAIADRVPKGQPPPAPPAHSDTASPPKPPSSTPPPAGARLDVNSKTTCAELRKSLHAMTRAAAAGPDQARLLQDLYRQVSFLSAAAGVNGYAELVQTAAVFEALLYTLVERPSLLSLSVSRTLASLVDFVEIVLQRVGQPAPILEGSACVLVVDDDPISNRLVVSALRQAHLEARSTEDPLTAWDWLQHDQFALVLLDIEMPGLNGFDLCKRLRGLPGYAKTPVIYFTVHTDFENRVKGTLSGGNDLIAKPVVPLELAAKVVVHLQRSRLLAQAEHAQAYKK